jgi:hypothetical protein
MMTEEDLQDSITDAETLPPVDYVALIEELNEREAIVPALDQDDLPDHIDADTRHKVKVELWRHQQWWWTPSRGFGPTGQERS